MLMFSVVVVSSGEGCGGVIGCLWKVWSDTFVVVLAVQTYLVGILVSICGNFIISVSLNIQVRVCWCVRMCWCVERFTKAFIQ